jgi:hypothetical protein
MIVYCGQEFDATPAELYAFKHDWRIEPKYMTPSFNHPLNKDDLADRELRLRDMAIAGDLGWGMLRAVLPTLNGVSDYLWLKREKEMRAEFQAWLASRTVNR